MIIKGQKAPVSSQPINHHRGTSFNTSAPGGASKYLAEGSSGSAAGQRHYPGLLPKINNQIKMAQIFDNSYALRTGTGNITSADRSQLGMYELNMLNNNNINMNQNNNNNKQHPNQNNASMNGSIGLSEGNNTGGASANRDVIMTANKTVGVGISNASLNGSGSVSITAGGGLNSATAAAYEQNLHYQYLLQQELNNIQNQNSNQGGQDQIRTNDQIVQLMSNINQQYHQHQQQLQNIQYQQQYQQQNQMNGQVQGIGPRGIELTSFFTSSNNQNNYNNYQNYSTNNNNHFQDQHLLLNETQSMASPLNAVNNMNDTSQLAENSTIVQEREMIQGILNHDYGSGVNGSDGQANQQDINPNSAVMNQDTISADNGHYTILKAKLFQPNIKDDGTTAADAMSQKMMFAGVGGGLFNQNQHQHNSSLISQGVSGGTVKYNNQAASESYQAYSPQQKSSNSGNNLQNFHQVIQSQQFQMGQNSGRGGGMSSGIAYGSHSLQKQQTMPSHYSKTSSNNAFGQGQNNQNLSLKEKQHEMARQLRQKKDLQQVKFYQTLTNQLTTSTQHQTRQIGNGPTTQGTNNQLNQSMPSSTAVGYTHLNTSATTQQLKQFNQLHQLNNSIAGIGGGISRGQAQHNQMANLKSQISRTRATFSQQPMARIATDKTSFQSANKSSRVGALNGISTSNGQGNHFINIQSHQNLKNQDAPENHVQSMNVAVGSSTGNLGNGSSNFVGNNNNNRPLTTNYNQNGTNPYDVDNKIQYAHSFGNTQQKYFHHSTHIAGPQNYNQTDQTVMLDQQTEQREDTQPDQEDTQHQISQQNLLSSSPDQNLN